jgi:hypothetical protein
LALCLKGPPNCPRIEPNEPADFETGEFTAACRPIDPLGCNRQQFGKFTGCDKSDSSLCGQEKPPGLPPSAPTRLLL